MKAQLIAALIQAFMSALSPDLLKDFADKVIDFIEDKVAESETKFDDKIVLPLCDQLRATFDILDNDE